MNKYVKPVGLSLVFVAAGGYWFFRDGPAVVTEAKAEEMGEGTVTIKHDDRGGKIIIGGATVDPCGRLIPIKAAFVGKKIPIEPESLRTKVKLSEGQYCISLLRESEARPTMLLQKCVTVKAGPNIPVDLSQPPAPATLIIDSKNGGDTVLVDGVDIGKTKATLLVEPAPAEHAVSLARLRNAGVGPWQGSVPAGGSLEVSFNLVGPIPQSPSNTRGWTP